MTAAEYQRVRAIFHGAWDRPAGERTAYLDGACGSDAVLRGRVEALLAAGAERGEFMANAAAPLTELAAANRETQADPNPKNIGRFRVIRLLGTGGMGAVYEAVQENPSRRVAIKTIRPGRTSPTLLRRFTHEAHILGRLRHPGIAQVYEAGVADDALGPTPYIAMELVDGIPLDHWRQKQPTRDERARLLARVCDAVQHAHGSSVVHRDLKPGNILVEPRGETGAERWQPRVLDFGVARLLNPGAGGTPATTMATDPGTLVGTLAYMSPEQVAGGGDVDARADVYALGVILFELLTDRLPRDTDGKPIAEAARIIRDDEPRRAASIDRSLRGDLDTICAKALERDRARRYQTAAELATDLRRYLGNEPIIARPATILYQARKFARRHTGFVAGLALAAAALIAGAAGVIWYAVAAHRQRDFALSQKAAADWTAYKLSIAAAEDNVVRNPGRTRKKLAEAPADYRNWEWRHLMARLSRDDTRVPSEPGFRTAATFTPQGRPLVAVSRAGRLEVVDPRTQEVIASLLAPSGLRGAVLSRAGSWMAAFCDPGGTVFTYDVRAQKQIVERSFGGRRILSIGLSPDGSILGVGVQHAGIRLLSAITGDSISDVDFAATHNGYSVFEFTPDNRQLICGVARDDSTFLSLYDLSNITQSRVVDEACSATFDRQGRGLATGTIRGIRVRDTQSLAIRSVIHGQFRNAYALGFSSNGEHLAGFVGKGAVHVWNVETGELERALTASDLTHGVALNERGDLVMVNTTDGVDLMSLDDAGVEVLRGHTNYVYNVAWSGDGRLIASGAWDGSVRVWDGRTGAPRAELAVQPVSPLAPVNAVAFSADSTALLVLTHNGELLTYDLATLLVPALPSPNAATNSATTRPASRPLDMRPKPTAEAQVASAEFWARARAGAKRVVTTGGERDSSSPDGAFLARVDDGDVVIMDRASGAEVRRVRAGRSAAIATAFTPDGARLAAAGDDRRVVVWEVRTGRMVAELRDHENPVYTITFTPDGARMASGDADGLILIWDTAHWEKVAELRGHTSYVHSLAFSPDGGTLCSGSGDGTLRLWSSAK